MWLIDVPEILFDILPSDVAVMVNEVAYVEEFVLVFVGVSMGFDDCAWDDA